jgi:hypothetical protein
MHDNNRSNNGKIGQVVAMCGNEKTQDFFLWNENVINVINHKIIQVT